MFLNNSSLTQRCFLDPHIEQIVNQKSGCGKIAVRPINFLVDLIAIPMALIESIGRVVFAILASPLVLIASCFPLEVMETSNERIHEVSGALQLHFKSGPTAKTTSAGEIVNFYQLEALDNLGQSLVRMVTLIPGLFTDAIFGVSSQS